MSARYGAWDVLDRSSDPVPGDVTVVEQLATTYGQTAEAIAASASRLQRLANLEGWTGKSAEAFAGAADDLHGDLSKSEQRYHDAGQALRGFVEPLRMARSESWAALTTGVEAQQDVDRHSTDTLVGVVDPTDAQQTAQQSQERAHGEAQDRLDAARRRLDNALDAFDEAAGAAADAIREAASHDKDSRWDNVKGGLRDFADAIDLKTIVHIVGIVTAVVAVVAIAVAMIATAPLWLATALFAAGMFLGGVMLAGDAVLLADGSGESDWFDIGLDVVGLVTLGYGRSLTAGARATATTSRETLAVTQGARASSAEAARLAATPDGVRAAAATQIVNPANNLRVWGTATQAAHGAEAARAGDGAAGALRAGEAATPSVLRSLPYLDRGAAQTAAELARLEDLAAGNPSVLRALQRGLQSLYAGVALNHAGNVGNVVSAGKLVGSDDNPVPVAVSPRDTLHWQLPH